MSKGFDKILEDFEKGLCSRINEAAPEGWSGTVKAMKKHKEIDNPFALANYMKKKGDTPHYAEEGIGSTIKNMFKGNPSNKMEPITSEQQAFIKRYFPKTRFMSNYMKNEEDMNAWVAFDNLDISFRSENGKLIASVGYYDNDSRSGNPLAHFNMDVSNDNGMKKLLNNQFMDESVKESGELFRGDTIDFNDPEILIHGYGRLLRSQLHNKIGSYLADMAEKAKQGNLEAVKYMLDKSPLGSLVDAALDAEKELNTPQMKRKATLASRKVK